ncbi:hypothetical protein [Agrobacterium fabrum]|uniref:hypothetical protein n=1 Tax=Agrobacterium fabrum TaxID=1176649 RepID=UPI003BA044BA
MTYPYRNDPALVKSVQALIETIQFDVNGRAGQGGNGGLTSDKAIRISGELSIMVDRILKQEAGRFPIEIASELKDKPIFNIAYDDGDGGWTTGCFETVTFEVAEDLCRKFHAEYVGRPYPNGKGHYTYRNVRIFVSDKISTLSVNALDLPELQPHAENAALEFESADWFWRTMDPDDSGDYPADAINRAGLGNYCVAEIACSFTGPRRFGFTAPVLEADSDEEEFLHFDTQAEAIEAAATRRAIIEARTDEETADA